MTLSKEAFFLEDGQPIITSGGSDSHAAAQCTKCSEVLMSSLEGIVPVSNPRRLHLTWCTQLLSTAKVSYLFGRRSSTFTPVGRAASRWGVLFSPPLIAHFFGGDGHGLQSSRDCFWLWAGSLLGVEAAWGSSMVRSLSSSSEMMISAICSRSGSEGG